MRRGPPWRRCPRRSASRTGPSALQDVVDVVDVEPEGTRGKRDRVHRHFRTTSRYEWMFWDMGYRKQTWPV